MTSGPQPRVLAHKHSATPGKPSLSFFLFLPPLHHSTRPSIPQCVSILAAPQSTALAAMMNYNKCVAPASASPHLQSGRHSLRSLVGCRHPAAGRSWRNYNAAENIPEPQPCHISWLHRSRQTSDPQSYRSNSRSTVTNYSQRSSSWLPSRRSSPASL
jgi:hypothetical protein